MKKRKNKCKSPSNTQQNMTIIACAQRLLNNTEVYCFRQELKDIIDYPDEALMEHNVVYRAIKLICEDGYDISDFMLCEIPDPCVVCFCSKDHSKNFDVYFDDFNGNGKKHLTSNDKYYLRDHTFCYAKLGTKNLDSGRVIENIVAMELLRRGYEVYVGALFKKEIGLVALKRSEKIYIQVSDNITLPETFKWEVEPLLKIKDAYPKMVIARTRSSEYKYEGVKIVDVADWLLDK